MKSSYLELLINSIRYLLNKLNESCNNPEKSEEYKSELYQQLNALLDEYIQLQMKT